MGTVTWNLVYAIGKPACVFAAITPRVICVNAANVAITGIHVAVVCATMAVCHGACWVAKVMANKAWAAGIRSCRSGVVT